MHTAHAQARCQQRAISNEVVETLLAYGQTRRRHGADVYYLDKSSRSRAAHALGRQRYLRMEKALDTYLVVSDSGDLITAGHRQERLKF
jgi:hypothetical protein